MPIRSNFINAALRLGNVLPNTTSPRGLACLPPQDKGDLTACRPKDRSDPVGNTDQLFATQTRRTHACPVAKALAPSPPACRSANIGGLLVSRQDTEADGAVEWFRGGLMVGRAGAGAQSDHPVTARPDHRPSPCRVGPDPLASTSPRRTAPCFAAVLRQCHLTRRHAGLAVGRSAGQHGLCGLHLVLVTAARHVSPRHPPPMRPKRNKGHGRDRHRQKAGAGDDQTRGRAGGVMGRLLLPDALHRKIFYPKPVKHPSVPPSRNPPSRPPVSGLYRAHDPA